MKKVLLIEDDPTLSQNIRQALMEDDLEVEAAFDALIAGKLLRRQKYDCVILDINLPGKNGFEICNELRQRDTQTPVLMLTAFGELEDKVKGYQSGADDYLTKPFYMRELLLRVHALMKRKERQGVNDHAEDLLEAGDLKIHPATGQVFRQGVEITLTPREFQLLKLLVRKQGELISKKELIREIWSTSVDVNTNTIEVYINFLRNKVDKPFQKQSIRTKVGYGYYFEAE